MKTFSLSTHSRLFAVPDYKKDYLFVGSGNRPYHTEPYRAESYALAFIKQGSVRLQAGLGSWEVIAPAIVTLGPSVIRYFSKNSEELKMDVIFFKDSFLLERHADLFFLFKYDFFGNNGLHVLKLSPLYYEKINKIYELLQLSQQGGNYHENEVVRGYIFALVYEIDAYYRQLSPEISSSLSGHPLFARFRQLVSSNYIHQHKLEFYADRLFLTSKSLSAAIKKHSGKPAGWWIDEAIVLEAKVLLQNRLLSIRQISDKLNFSDQSVFGKFFRANAGCSPADYRRLAS